MKKTNRILIIDDDTEVQRMLGRMLEMEGYQVHSVPDSRLALEALEQYHPDLVVLDIRMPGLDGFQVVRLIRQRSDVPIIMLSGITDAASLQKAISLGADDYVHKPFRGKELIARIRAKLRRTEKPGLRCLN